MRSIWVARINPLLQKIRFKEFGDNHFGRTFKTCTVIDITQANLKIGLKVAFDTLRPLIVQQGEIMNTELFMCARFQAKPEHKDELRVEFMHRIAPA